MQRTQEEFRRGTGAPEPQHSEDLERAEAPLWVLVLAAIRAKRRLAIIVAIGVLVIGIVGIVLVPRRYTSNGSFVVEAAPAGGGMGGAMAIISQLNPNLAGGDSPKFYVDLVRSRPLMEALLVLVPRAQCGLRPNASLLSILGSTGDDSVQNLARGVATLRGRVDARYDLRTGVISISVEAACPALARELADSLIGSINSFNVDRRQTRAKLRREFSEQRAREADGALRAAEQALSDFQLANRITAAPRLTLEAERLQRRVSEQQEIASGLRREASAARLDEINSIPALTVIETPDLPVKPSYPKRRVWGIALLVLAALFGATVALGSFLRGATPPQDDRLGRVAHARLRAILGLRSAARVAA